MKKHRIKIFSKILCWTISIVVFSVACQDLNKEIPLENNLEPKALNSDLIPGKYIVVLHESTISFKKSARYLDNQSSMRVVATDLSLKYKINPNKITRVYTNALSGFAIDLEDEELQRMKQDPSIKFIEQDAYAYASFQKKSPPGKDPVDPVDPVDPGTGTATTIWGLDRLDQRNLPLDQSFSSTTTGKGVTVYIMDSGILTDHQEFQGRASLGFDPSGLFLQDCNGHGTHVAGIVGGATTGVAKGVNLVSVKVLGAYDPEFPCANWGPYSQMIEALDWIAANAFRPAVVNMSIQGGKNDAFNLAVNNVFHSGIPVIVSAGNYSDDASLFSPASAEKAFTIGASDTFDNRAAFSNVGNPVKIFAPGENIRSSFIGSNSSYANYSGTSMSAPYVVGVAALFLETNPTASPQQVYDFLLQTSTKNKVTLSGSLNNHLLFSGLNTSGAGSIDPNRVNYAFDITATPMKESGTTWHIVLNWSPVKSAIYFDVFVNGSLTGQVSNNGGGIIYQQGAKTRTTRTYKMCVQGTTQCSNTVTVNF
jgi:subtilisin family serine protease